MNQKKEVTIYDIARELNYSPSTISRALNDHKSISKKTIKVIKKAALEMGYRPNSLAASLRNNRSNTIGILISRINRPFMSTLISGIEETARKAGFNVIISQSNDSYENEVDNSKVLYDSRVGGLIVSLAMETRNIEHFQQFRDQGIPIVFVDRVPKTFSSYKVVIDNYTAGYNATKHLIDQGCRRIAHFAGAQRRNIYEDRKKGYLDALSEYGLPIDKDLIIHAKTLSFEEGEKATNKLLDLPHPPDGIFSANDTAAVSAIICAKKRGINIPEDLAIIGFNDDPIASIVDPPLSTVTHPAAKMGKIAAQRILEHDQKNADNNLSEVTVLSTEIIVRASSKRIK
ncbi:LacI family DNA-binding transcriptional regulator [Robertkochia solimangrovi]|uniref:LacI family DNA-binding transcriptional regulator n=1 Tax=Robertkochia solimangrovi TaxID=2213046 RepID=UPI00117F3DCD|nr:LacI family DNA-binding transcriptional regulator [Robertkochia solimangrovi]TRZ42501.1 LacI family transcriptional regulator [Robertkochia solimangrovi]